MSTPQARELGRLLRLMVKARAEVADQTMELIVGPLASELGTTGKGFENYYTGKARIEPRAVRILLAAGAACPYLSRAWGQRLLRLTGCDRYDEMLELLDRHWPPPAGPPALPPRAASNLPAPSYPAFVMRHSAYAQVAEALSARTPVAVIVGQGGMGKTSLAREVAGRCLDRARPPAPGEPPPFDAAVWVSDKDEPGATRLGAVLDAIAITLDYPELTRFEPARRQREVDQLLRGRRALLVLDNLETVSDPALLAWLLRLPEPSKALVTTRAYPAAFQDRGPWRVELGRMSEREGRDFIAQHSRSIGLAPPDVGAQQALMAAVGGNPQAMAVALGLAKRSGRPVAALVGDTVVELAAALEQLVAAGWASLGPPERHTLLALCLFPGSADDGALAEVAGLAPDAFYAAAAALSDLALIETEAAARRALHPVTRLFVAGRLGEDGLFAAAARARLLAWAVGYAEAHGGHRPNEPESLARVEAEEPTLWATLLWAGEHGRPREAIVLARQLEYFYYTRARWARNAELYGRYLAAARQAGDREAQIDALALRVQLLSRQGRPEQAADEIAALAALARDAGLRGLSFFRARHAPALAALARGDLEGAAAGWAAILAQVEERGVSAGLAVGARHWLAVCLHRQGEPGAARAMMEASLAGALAQGNRRRAARNLIALAQFALDAGQPQEAQERLLAAREQDPAPDQEQRAHELHARGRLMAARGEGAARDTLREALGLFERMGMEDELGEVRGRLAEVG